tara:strand:- start:4629 stop:4958 length:330 start_codon:yes stop_codon:yes gene_type:complete
MRDNVIHFPGGKKEHSDELDSHFKIIDDLLLLLMEGCSEATNDALYFYRFGFTEEARESLEDGMGKLLCLMQLLNEKGVVRKKEVDYNCAATRQQLIEIGVLKGDKGRD